MRETKEPTSRRARPLLLACLVAVAACGAEDRLPTGPERPTSSMNAGGTCELGLTETEILAEITALLAEVDALEASGALSAGQARALRTHLDNAARALAGGRSCAARASLGAFREQVGSFVTDGILTEAEAGPLLEGADRALGDAPVMVPATIVGGDGHTCGLTAAGRAYCWGFNLSGQLGNGTSGGSEQLPVAVQGGHIFEFIAAGGTFTCGLTPAGAAWCWGSNASGQLGIGTGGADVTETATPVAVSGGLRFSTLGLGSFHACGLAAGGVAYCWGSNDAGQIGKGEGGFTSPTQREPVAVLGGQSFVRVSAGRSQTCALTATGAAWCWGDHFPAGTSLSPEPVVGGHTFMDLVAGTRHTCALTTLGAAYCWGINHRGQLGTGNVGIESSASAPAAVIGGFTFAALGGAGDEHTCALTAAGEAYCWGSNPFGQLGDGSIPPRPSPGPVAGGLTFLGLDAGRLHTCGLSAEATAYCWGMNAFGQIGDGTTADAASPTPVSGWAALP